MKHIAQTIGLGLACLSALASSPKAADWAVGSGGAVRDFGSIKDYRNAAVPVPAPTPSSPYAKDYYIRGDIGYNLATDVSITTSGETVSRNGEDLNGFLFGSIGAGRYLTPSLRAELSFDFRPKKTVTQGNHSYDRTIKVNGATLIDATSGAKIATTDTLTYHVSLQDDSSTADQTGFLNLFYDFHDAQHSRLTPYIGAGVGLSSRRFKRATTQTAVCTYAVNTRKGTNTPGVDYGFNPGPGTCPNTGPDVSQAKVDGSNYTADIGIAAAIMIGLGYEVSPGITWETGYRGVWEGAALKLNVGDIVGDSNGPTSSSVSIGTRFDHELRTGVRIDLW